MNEEWGEEMTPAEAMAALEELRERHVHHMKSELARGNTRVADEDARVLGIFDKVLDVIMRLDRALIRARAMLAQVGRGGK